MELTKEQKEKLQKLASEMAIEAKNVREDYKKNPSEMSGSITQLNINSPILNKNSDDN